MNRKNKDQQALVEQSNKLQEDLRGNERKLSLVDYSTIKTFKNYTVGQFSTFAVQRQKQLDDSASLLDFIIRQAIQSHLKKIKNMLNQVKQSIARSQFYQEKLKKQFKNDSVSIYNFVEDPISQYLNIAQFTSIKQFVSDFCQKIIILSQVSVIQGKITKLSDFKIQEYLIQQNKIFIPSKYNNKVFLRLGKDLIPSYHFLQNGKLRNKNQFFGMSEQQKEIIMSMIAQFLESKGVIIEKQFIKKKIDNQLSQISQ